MKTVFLFLIVLVLAACHCEKNTPATTAGSPNVQPAMRDEETALKNLVVSFYSMGGGTDRNSARKFEDFIFNYSEKTKTHVPYKKILWGKEGEVDYCVDLSGLVANARTKFITDVKDLLGGVQAHINENRPCRELK